MTTKTNSDANRRDFLKLASVSAPAAVAAATLGGAEVKAETGDASDERMQDTAHTRAYLDSARF